MDFDYDLLAKEYAQHRRVHPTVLRELLEQGRPGPESAVLEVGCGTANYLAAIQQATGCKAWGIEPSAQMLERAAEKGQKLRLARGRAEVIPLPNASFDLVFTVDVIHHVQDRAAYYQEAYRVLKPGGLLCTVTDSEAIIRSREPLSVYFPDTVPLELARYPSVDDLAGLMEGAGFRHLQEDTVEISYQTRDIGPYRNRAYSALHLISDELFAAGIRRMEGDLRHGPIRCVPRYVLLWGTKG